MCNSKNPKKATWFTGSNPLVYTMENRMSNSLNLLGQDNNMSVFSFKVGNKNYVGKGELTNSGKNFRYLTHVQTNNFVNNLEEAVKLF